MQPDMLLLIAALFALLAILALMWLFRSRAKPTPAEMRHFARTKLLSLIRKKKEGVLELSAETGIPLKITKKLLNELVNERKARRAGRLFYANEAGHNA